MKNRVLLFTSLFAALAAVPAWAEDANWTEIGKSDIAEDIAAHEQGGVRQGISHLTRLTREAI